MVSRPDADKGHDHPILVLQPGSSGMQRLCQPLADGAKAKQRKTKRFHRFPFAILVSRRRQRTLLHLPPPMGEIPISCHIRGSWTSDMPDRPQAGLLFMALTER